MASQAEIDLVVNASNTLSQLQADLNRVVAAAQATADPVQLQAAINLRSSIDRLERELAIAVAAAQRSTPDIRVGVDIDEDSLRRFNISLRSLATTAGRALGPVAALGTSLATLGAAAGVGAPLLAGLVTAAQQLAPAAAVATQGVLALQLATGTLKLALSGVEDAITSAFDPDVKPEELEKQLKRLAPEARSFVRALIDMRGAFNRLRLQTQNLFFKNLDGLLKGLGTRAFPVVRDAIRNTSIVLNRMAAGVLNAAGELAENGTLRQALTGTVRGLRNLQNVPGRVVTAFGQLAAAAAPAFARITQVVDRVSRQISDRLTNAFKSGALERSIDRAVTEFGKLFRAIGNIGGALRNVFNAAAGPGGSFFTLLENVTQQIEEITASKGFQDTLGALARVMREIGANIGPLLLNIFEELGPVVQRLEAPVTRLVNLLGDELNETVDKLGPVLTEAAETFDKIERALEPFVKLLFDMVQAALPGVQRGLEFVGKIVEDLRPGIEKFTAALGPFVTKVIELSLAIGERLFQALEFILPKIIEVQNILIGPLSDAFRVATEFLDILVSFINGDTDEAFRKFIDLGNRVNEEVSKAFNSLKDRVTGALATLRNKIISEFSNALIEARNAVNRKLGEIIIFFSNLPGRIRSALGDLGGLLFSVGQDIVEGMIRGVQAKIGALIGTLEDLANRARNAVADVLGIASPSKVFAELGDNMVEGIQVGLRRSADALRSDLTGLGLSLPTALAGAGGLTAPEREILTPDVNVFIGNEALDRRTDARIERSFKSRSIIAAQGVRR